MIPDFPATRRILEQAVVDGAFPAATIEVGRMAGPIWTESFGRLTYDVDAAAATIDTVFDLASLTKVIATTSLIVRLVGAKRLNWDTPLSERLEGWSEGARSGIQIRHLLDHSAGLAAHARLWETARGRREFEAAIASLPIERAPGVASVYSDLGFILLGLVIGDLLDRPLDDAFAMFTTELGLEEIRYRPPDGWLPRTAPTEFDSWRGRLAYGEVHDENAAALGGIAGHAGLFGTAPAVGRFARLVLRSFQEPTGLATPSQMHHVATRTGVPGSSRALGWDTMLPSSSCGTRMSPTAIGHTGFTGTSLWIDWERDRYVTLLTNRVHPTRKNDRIAALRPRVHDAVLDDLDGRVRGEAER